MIVKLLTEHHLECLSLKGGCKCSSESTHVKCHIVGILMHWLKYSLLAKSLVLIQLLLKHEKMFSLHKDFLTYAMHYHRESARRK